MNIRQELIVVTLVHAIFLYAFFCALLYSIKKNASLFLVAFILLMIAGVGIAYVGFIINDIISHVKHPFQ